MNEEEWLASTDPAAMLRFLGGRLSQRKRLLFECGCCRLVEHLFEDPWNDEGPELSLRAVEVTERYADGEASRDERRTAADAVEMAAARLQQNTELEDPATPLFACEAAAVVARDDPVRPAWEWVVITLGAERMDPLYLQAHHAWREPQTQQRLQREAGEANESGQNEGRRAVAGLLRDVAGNPFRRAPAIDPAWLAWKDGAVPRLARAIYAERAFDRLPLLADALEDAGCADPDLLAHCRSGGPHIRGCWAVDLLLGKS